MGEPPFVDDFVFPIVELSPTPEGRSKLKELLGTGFVIGRRGFALTAGHVMPTTETDIYALFVIEGKRTPLSITAAHQHPSEDVCLLQINGRPPVPPFTLDTTWQGGWCDYWMCGYPARALYEDRRRVDPCGMPVARPDLIHAKGHTRRRVTADLEHPSIRGTHFFELSAAVGDGCSGGPVFKVPLQGWPWEVLGIYVGATTIEADGLTLNVGLAARVESFATWAPSAVGRTLQEEAWDRTP